MEVAVQAAEMERPHAEIVVVKNHLFRGLVIVILAMRGSLIGRIAIGTKSSTYSTYINGLSTLLHIAIRRAVCKKLNQLTKDYRRIPLEQRVYFYSGKPCMCAW